MHLPSALAFSFEPLSSFSIGQAGVRGSSSTCAGPPPGLGFGGGVWLEGGVVVVDDPRGGVASSSAVTGLRTSSTDAPAQAMRVIRTTIAVTHGHRGVTITGKALHA